MFFDILKLAAEGGRDVAPPTSVSLLPRPEGEGDGCARQYPTAMIIPLIGTLDPPVKLPFAVNLSHPGATIDHRFRRLLAVHKHAQLNLIVADSLLFENAESLGVLHVSHHLGRDELLG